MNEAENEKIITFGIKIPQSLRDQFKAMKTEGAFDTDAMLFETMVERYYNPIKVNKGNEESIGKLKAELSEREKAVKELEEVKSLNEKEINRLTSEHETLNQQVNELQTALAQMETNNRDSIELLNKDFANRKAATLKDHVLVPVTPLDRKCLEWMAERENKERKRNDIKPENFFMYALKEMLIKGNKFSIDCVPDKVIRKFEQELKGKEISNE